MLVLRRLCHHHHLLTPTISSSKPCIIHRRLLSTGEPVSDPLRILYCGSDDFSCVSLRALHHEQQRNRDLIRSIDIVVRPAKRTGRGLKVLSQVPLQSLAEELRLPIHIRDTFTGWTMPESINLIIAVSFGLFVPPRLLRMAKYGGLNVHPSLIPDLRGPAPIHHAILAGRTHTGLTLQTLDEKSFDHGIRLAQTPLPGIPIPNDSDTASLSDILAEHGAEMLVNGLREGLHVGPVADIGWQPAVADQSAGSGLLHAHRLSKANMRLLWGVHDVAAVGRMGRVFGSLWAEVGSPVPNNSGGKRVILEDVAGVESGGGGGSLARAGRLRWLKGPEEKEGGEDVGDDKVQNHQNNPYLDLETFTNGHDLYVALPAGRGFVRICRAKVEGKPSVSAIKALTPFIF